MRAGTYNVIQDFGLTEDDGYISFDPYWLIAIYRLGLPLSFDRASMSSVTTDLSQGALLRAQKPLVITDDCLSLTITNTKMSYSKQLSCFLKQTNVNYLVEILPGDWVLAWLVNNRDQRDSLLTRIDAGDPDNPCNKFNDGLKFVGRVEEIFKEITVEPQMGTKTANYSLNATGFKELGTQIYYDFTFASNDQVAQDVGQWCGRFGIDARRIFSANAGSSNIKEDNVNDIIPLLMNLAIGDGIPQTGDNESGFGSNKVDIPAVGGGSVSATINTSAPFAYMIPTSVGYALGKTGVAAAKTHDVIAYQDILEMIIGVQSYSAKSGNQVFVPDLNTAAPGYTPSRRITKFPMMGTFLPMMPDFANRPLWSVFQQYLNPTINEIYSCLHVNPDGLVVPTVVMRQIPFTTDAFVRPAEPKNPNDTSNLDAISGGDALNAPDPSKANHFNTTKFLDLPRWQIPDTMIRHVSLGRSDATRTNFVHVYGQSAYLGEQNVPIQAQMIENKPVRDDLDIMRSGLRPYMTTVECWVSDQHNKVPGLWMRLIADWAMGSQYTLTGSVESLGIQAPICEGDNIVMDGCVYHIMSVHHTASINPSTGVKTWSTSLQLTNGLRDQADNTVVASTDADVSIGLQPIYPGFSKIDNTGFDPGLTLEQQLTTGGDTERDPDWDSPEAQSSTEDAPSQLNPGSGDPTQPGSTSQSFSKGKGDIK
jgi:hypothetical protein